MAIDVGPYSAPSFFDVDGDGDLDAVVGEYYGGLQTFTNTTPPQAPWSDVTVTPQKDAPTLSGLAPSVTFTQADVNAAPQLLDADVTFDDAEGVSTAAACAYRACWPRISVGIRDEGNGAGQIGWRAGPSPTAASPSAPSRAASGRR